VFAAVLDAQVAELAKRAGPVRRPVDPAEAVRDLMPGACRHVCGTRPTSTFTCRSLIGHGFGAAADYRWRSF
jgi:hypothetical protein